MWGLSMRGLPSLANGAGLLSIRDVRGLE